MAEDGRLGYGDGSSPLARGLPAVRGVEDGSIRIIPARAGFTGVGFIVRFLSGDHPRSRGVYYSKVTVGTDYSWIIPARAGFTISVGWPSHASTDHPRSRGVYA